jgi:hypothetical protein
MRERRRKSYGSDAPGWGDKSLPPAFLARHNGDPEKGWFESLTPRGKSVLLVSCILVAGLVVVVALSAAGQLKTGTGSRGRPAPRHQAAKRRPPEPKLFLSIRTKNAALELSIITFGLSNLLLKMEGTSRQMQKDLSDGYGVGSAGSWSAKLEVIADGPDGGVPPGDTTGPGSATGSAIADRYVPVYAKYLARVEETRKMAKGLDLAPPEEAHRGELMGACDSLSRDISVVIDGLNRLRAPGEEDAGDIVRGIDNAVGRIEASQARLEALLGQPAR